METTLLTAEKAKTIAKNQKALTDLLDEIFGKAFKGEYILVLSEEISSDLIVSLEELGYKVEIREGIKTLYIISWL